MNYLIFRNGISEGSYIGEVTDKRIAGQAAQGLIYKEVSDEEFSHPLGTHLLAEDGTLSADTGKRAELQKKKDDREKAKTDIMSLDLTKPLGNLEESLKAVITHIRGF